MELKEIMALDEKYLAHTYGRYPVAFTGGSNATLDGADGKRYIDFGAGIAVNIFGVGDKAWRAAVDAQLDAIQHVSNYYYSEPTARLAELLCTRSGAKRVFFSNSGGEANECAMKAARKYSYEKYGEGRSKIVSLKGSFHGRTLFTLTATGQREFHRYYDPFVPDVAYAEPTAEDLIRAADGRTCAVILECIQGEGGVNVLDGEFVEAAAEHCAKHDILLIVDEVQTGCGRTGKLFSYENFGITPDIVTTAKGLAGGLPIGATLFFDKTEGVYRPGDHGSTFGGNPVSCAAALSVVSRITDDFLLEVQGKGAYLQAKLKGFDGVREVTGMGMMLGILPERPAREVAMRCLERGLLVLTAHDKVRLLPPLTITKSEMDEGLSILKGVLS